jgi:hypothetical protein
MGRNMILMVAFSSLAWIHARGQDANTLVQKVRDRLAKVSSYEAEGILKTNVPFLKVPVTQVKVYFKSPDQFRLRNETGISLVPKTIASISLNKLLEGKYDVLDAGSEKIAGITLRIVKLLPSDDKQEVVLSTLYIDASSLLIIKARTTTRDNGTYEVLLTYGKYIDYALPDRVICLFDAKDYKLPKGITFDYDDGSKKKPEDAAANTKGQVEIIYSSYLINKNIPETVFKEQP